MKTRPQRDYANTIFNKALLSKKTKRYQAKSLQRAPPNWTRCSDNGTPMKPCCSNTPGKPAP